MAAYSLQDLVDQFSAFAGSPPPGLTADADGVLAFSTQVSGVHVTITHNPIAHGDEAMVFVFFGPLPAGAEAEAMRRLLAANLEMRTPRAPSFALDASSREVVLRYAYAMSGASGEGLWNGLKAIAAHALRWRDDFFIDASVSPSDFGLLA